MVLRNRELRLILLNLSPLISKNCIINFEQNFMDEEGSWSEMPPERSQFESDDDFQERMEYLYGEDRNL